MSVDLETIIKDYKTDADIVSDFIKTSEDVVAFDRA